MSGVVNTVVEHANRLTDNVQGVLGHGTLGKIFEFTGADNIKNATKGLQQSGTAFANGDIKGGIKGMFAPYVEQAKGLTSDVMDTIHGPYDTPNIAVQDPNRVARDQADARASAARAAQADQMKTTPGRGGTVLTDNYNYRT